MKKFSKMLALGMALSLAFGVTVCAANSPTVGDANLGGTIEVTPEGLEEGQEIVVGRTSETYVEKAQNIIQDPSVQASITNGITVGAGKKAVPKAVVAAFEVSLKEAGNEVEVGPNGVTLTFNFAGFDRGKKYAVLHFTSQYTFEVIPATPTDDGVKATFSSLSPVAIVEVGEEAADTNTGGNNTGSQSSSQSEAPRSPQTGEVLPVAGIMALICLAGAAVCAGKVRYNKQ